MAKYKIRLLRGAVVQRLSCLVARKATEFASGDILNCVLDMYHPMKPTD